METSPEVNRELHVREYYVGRKEGNIILGVKPRPVFPEDLISDVKGRRERRSMSVHGFEIGYSTFTYTVPYRMNLRRPYTGNRGNSEKGVERRTCHWYYLETGDKIWSLVILGPRDFCTILSKSWMKRDGFSQDIHFLFIRR